MFNIVLYQPEIPPNTGNIMRLAANTGCRLHLIEPLGFSLDDKHMRRAGLDYELPFPLKLYTSIEDFYQHNNNLNHTDFNSNQKENRPIIYLCSTKANRNYAAVSYKPGDTFIFGPETRGLPQEMLQTFPEQQKITIPMKPGARSLNLANSVAIIVYEAWRQQSFI